MIEFLTYLHDLNLAVVQLVVLTFPIWTVFLVGMSQTGAQK